MPGPLPLCGEPNECGMAAGKSECWCANVTISRDALAAVPEGAKGKVCICVKCAEAAKARAGAS